MVFPEVSEQRCWNHRIVNALKTLPEKLSGGGRALLTKRPYAETRAEAERRRGVFHAFRNTVRRRVPETVTMQISDQRGTAPRAVFDRFPHVRAPA